MKARTWAEFDRKRAGIGAQMVGALEYFEENPDEATDARLAQAFRRYAEQMRAIEMPAKESR